MSIPYFVWNGTDSRNMGIRCNRVPIVRPEERVNHVTIPGRAGELTQLEGNDVYNSYIQTVQLSVEGASNVRPAEAWLTGAGYVTFHAQPTLCQKARIINAVTFEKHSRNLDVWHADVQFYCEPYKTAVLENTITLSAGSSTINNPGDLVSYPSIVVTGSGSGSIMMGGHTLTLTSLVSGSVVDSEMQWVLQSGTPRPSTWTGEFPILGAGSNSVTIAGGITRVVITPRFRYL